MTHGEKRELFTFSLSMLLLYMRGQGYRPRVKYVTRGNNWGDSLHPWGLAADIDLFDKDGQYLELTEDHAQFGAVWESLHPLNSWGGHFDDGNHYSVQHEGLK